MSARETHTRIRWFSRMVKLLIGAAIALFHTTHAHDTSFSCTTVTSNATVSIRRRSALSRFAVRVGLIIVLILAQAVSPFGVQTAQAASYNQTFTTTGSGSIAVPVGVTSLTVQIWGAGGGGGGGAINARSQTLRYTSSGGGGGYSLRTWSDPSTGTLSYTVGGGGSGGNPCRTTNTTLCTASSGGGGAASTVTFNSTTVTANGGGGGGGGKPNNTASGGNGGTATNGTTNTTGGTGSNGKFLSNGNVSGGSGGTGAGSGGNNGGKGGDSYNASTTMPDSGSGGSNGKVTISYTYYVAPTVTDIVTATGAGVTADYTVKSNGEWPNSTIGTNRDTRTVAITGTNFARVSAVTVGGTNCANYAVNSTTSITCTLATTNKSGTQLVQVTTDAGKTTSTATLGTTAISYVVAPAVSSVDYSNAKINGQLPDTLSGTTWSSVTSTANTINGTNLTGGGFATTASVTMGGTACASYSLTSATKAACNMPNWGSAGSKTVQVRNAYGASGTTVAITAVAAPTLTSISPNSGLAVAGGTEITLTGTNYQSDFTTTVGGTDCTAKIYTNATSSKCTTPAKTAGSSQSVVTRTAYGTSSGVNVSYAAVPAVTDVITATGAGVTADYTVKTNGEWPNATIGTSRTTRTLKITGTDFTNVSAVTVGGTDCASYAVNSATQITCTLATDTKSGTQLVQVTTPSGSSSSTATAGTNAIVYVAAPGVSSVTYTNAKTNGQRPDTLSSTTWTSVTSTDNTINGTNLTGGGFATTASVTMGGTACASYSLTNATTATCNMPNWGSAGSKAVQVQNAYGSSGTSVGVTAMAAPTIASLSPTTVPSAGGTTVTLTGANFNSTFTTTVGGTNCTSKSFTNATTSTCITPALTVGNNNVVTRTPYGTSAAASLEYKDPILSLEMSGSGVSLSGGIGDLWTDTLTARVKTDNPTGYYLTVESSQPDLKCVSDGNTHTLPAIIGTSLLDGNNGNVNTWGYKVGSGTPNHSTTWTGLTSSPVTIDSSGSATDLTNGRDTEIWFGTRVNHTQPACSGYATTVTVTVVPE